MLPAPGQAAITFSRIGERTVVRRAFSTSPLKLLNPINHGAPHPDPLPAQRGEGDAQRRVRGAAAWVYLASYGGGLVDGDALRIDIDVERGAAAVISTQASTKIYRSPRGTSQTLHAEVADDALLVLAPDPVVCFAQSSYVQEQEIRLAPRAALVLVDWLMGGRVARGERWQLDRYDSVTQIWCGERRLLYDALRLTPEDGDVAVRMGRFNTLLSVVVAGVAEASRIQQEIAAMPLDKRADLLISASPLRDAALIVRIASTSTERAAQTLRRLLAFLPPLLGDDPWSRKW